MRVYAIVNVANTSLDARIGSTLVVPSGLAAAVHQCPKRGDWFVPSSAHLTKPPLIPGVVVSRENMPERLAALGRRSRGKRTVPSATRLSGEHRAEGSFLAYEPEEQAA